MAFDFSSGFAGLVLGSVLGLVLSVLIEDYLKSRRRELQKRVARALRRGTGSLNDASRTFTLGPLATPFFIYEGDGENVIDEQAVRCSVDDVFVEQVPDEVMQWRADIEREQEERRARGEPHFWNGPSYALVSATPERVGVDEEPGVALRFQHSDYFMFLATQRLDQPLNDGTTLRSRYLNGELFADPVFMRSSFGVNVAFVTADDQLIVTQRSDIVGSSPGVWNSSANEGLSRGLDSNGRTPPNLYNVARRGVTEELAISPESYRLEMLAVTLDVEKHQWGALFIARAYSLEAADVQEQISRGVPDRWENKQIVFVPHRIANVIEFLLEPSRRNEFSSVAPALFYFSLVRTYGRYRVERETAKMIRRLS